MTFSLFGIKFELSYIFFSVVVIFLAFDRTGIYLPLLIGVIIHEMSHIIFILIFKSKVSSIRLIIGAISVEYVEICSKIKKIIALLAGPISNILLAYIFYCFNLEIWCAVNIVLGLYNLLPINGLDGGAVLGEILEQFCSERTVNAIINILTVLVLSGYSFLWIYNSNDIRSNISVILLLIYIITPLIVKKVLKDKSF